MSSPSLSVIEWTCLAYGVSEPGEWTNALICEDLGVPDAGTNTRVIHAVAKLRRMGLIEPFGGYRIAPTIPMFAAPTERSHPTTQEVFRVISESQPISLADLRKTAFGDTGVIGKAVRELVECGAVTPPNYIWPTQTGIDTLAARPKHPTTKAGRPRRRR